MKKISFKLIFLNTLIILVCLIHGCTGSGGWSIPAASDNSAPVVVITTPLAGNISDEGVPVTFTGSADDPEDGALMGGALVWTSDRDGQIGTGLTFDTAALTRGVHVITLTATDQSGSAGTASITITVRTPWMDAQWGYRQQITISSTMAPSDQADFPVLIQITDDTNPVFANALANGDDILFTDMDGVNQLDHEIELYSPAGTEELDAWVRIPVLSSTADTVIYMYYGNAGAANQENPTGVWDSNFLGVWHMADDPSTDTDGDCGGGTAEVCDSTSYNFDGEAGGGMTPGDLVPGQIGESLDFDGINDWIELGSPFALSDNFTVEGWINFRSLVGNPSIFGRPWNWHFQIYNDGRLWFRRWSVYQGRLSTTVLSTDRWYYAAFTLAAGPTNNLNMYIDGVPETVFPNDDIPTPVWSSYTFRMARVQGFPDIAWYDGFLDEMRISDTVRSPEWIEAAFNSQNNPAGFLTFDVEEVQ